LPGGVGEHESAFFPQVAGEVALAPLGCLMLGEQVNEPGRQRDGPSARSGFDVIEDQAAFLSLGAPAGMPGAVRSTRWWAAALMPTTTGLTWGHLVVALTTLVGVITPVLPGPALQCVANLDGSCGEVDSCPLKAQRFALSQAEGERDRPAGAIAAVRSGQEQSLGFLDGQRLDLFFLDAGALAVIAALINTCFLRTASLSDARRVRCTWWMVPAARPAARILL
jgi:hypothetical protein